MTHARLNAISSAALVAIAALVSAIPFAAEAGGGHGNGGRSNSNNGQIKISHPIIVTRPKHDRDDRKDERPRAKDADSRDDKRDPKTKSEAKADDAAAKGRDTDKSKLRVQAAPPAAAAHPAPVGPAAPAASTAAIGGTFRSGAIVANSGGLLKPVVTPSNSSGAAKYFDVYKDDARVIGHYVSAGAHEVASVAKASASTAAAAAKSVYHFIGGLF
jgi:hypothetical protein